MEHNQSLTLINTYFSKQAKCLLEEFGEFYPFSAGIDADGKIVPLSVYFGEEHPPVIEVIKHFEEMLQQKLLEKKLTCVAICVDVMVTHPALQIKMDALQIRYQNLGKESIDYYLPYARSKENSIEFLDAYHEDGTLELI
jgi:hypothetical protein